MSGALHAVGAAGAHILVAEDEPEIRANLQRLLRLEGYDVSVAVDGRQALAAIRVRRPDLLLTDLMMPELDGEALLRLLRNDPATAGMPVLLLTAGADASDRQRGVAAGASAVLIKPFRQQALLACIRSLLAADSGWGE